MPTAPGPHRPAGPASGDIDYNDYIDCIDFTECSDYIEYIDYIDCSDHIDYIDYTDYIDYIATGWWLMGPGSKAQGGQGPRAGQSVDPLRSVVLRTERSSPPCAPAALRAARRKNAPAPRCGAPH